MQGRIQHLSQQPQEKCETYLRNIIFNKFQAQQTSCEVYINPIPRKRLYCCP